MKILQVSKTNYTTNCNPTMGSKTGVCRRAAADEVARKIGYAQRALESTRVYNDMCKFGNLLGVRNLYDRFYNMARNGATKDEIDEAIRNL